MIETSRDICIQRIFWLFADRQENGLDRILTRAPRAEAITVGLKAGFPFWFESTFGECLLRSRFHDGYP